MHNATCTCKAYMYKHQLIVALYMTVAATLLYSWTKSPTLKFPFHPLLALHNLPTVPLPR